MKRVFPLVLATLFSLTSTAQTIAEKKEGYQKTTDSEMDPQSLTHLRYVNEELDEKRFELKQLYDQALQLYNSHASQEKYAHLLTQIRLIKEEIKEMQRMWRDETSTLVQNEEYALWHQPETTMQQLVMDYGAPDFIYLVPPEVGGIRMSLNSNIPIPRESWGECLELILNQYGIGMRELNPFLRELYIMRNDPAGIKAIIDQPEQLEFYPPHTRLCYLLNSNATDPRGDLLFLQKFSNPTKAKIEIIAGKIFITSSVDTIHELLKLYEFAKSGNREQDFQLVSLSKIDAGEMEVILNSAFHNGNVSGEGSTLRVIPLQNLTQSLFLTGSKGDVEKAQKLIQDVEAQVEDPLEKTVFWYTTKHSEAEELAAVLAQVYDLLISNPAAFSTEKVVEKAVENKGEEKLAVPAIHVGPSGEKRTSHKTADGRNNFIVDPKTGAIIMVVEQEALPKIKELLKKLDVPKKMVQIEVLLFEKKISNHSKFGLNLLRMGSQATQAATSAMSWGATPGAGILEFLISRSKGSGIPAYDLAYQFMLGQDDVQINASPSVTTINQTPATIAIVEEISINAGADDKNNQIYNRAQYGIQMEITPTINMDEGDQGCEFITLDTDITFDTTKNSKDDRPDVTRRHIKNHVRIADGQTVILGGLRRKNTEDAKDSIPFLGEIPGIGKLFSHTEMHDSSTEMFVFITPKIIADPIEDAERLRKEELKKRPGDVPEYLHELVEAQSREKKRLFEGSLTTLFGEGHANGTVHNRKRIEEYDGR